MYQTIKILNSKLLLPRSSDTIIRKRLYHLLDDIPKKRLTTIVAGAGYGKTTLIAQAVRYLNLNTVWYRLDKSDKDFITFLSYLTAGIKTYFPELGEETFCRIEEAQSLGREREAILAVFLSEIENLVKKDLIIVLDDYHLVRESPEIRDTGKFFLAHLPPHIHLIIISRKDPDVHLSRLRALREVLDIREEDLTFTIPEIEALYLEIFDISLQTESIRILHQKTAGWVSGLILFYHSVRDKGPEEIENLLVRLKGSYRIIASYLEENVYDLQPDKIKDFLTKTSILSRINAEFCNHFLRIDNSRDILMGLEENHLFTFPFDEQREKYYYHHLLQEFLQTKLGDELGRKGILKLHKEAAVLWEKQGEYEDALKHYLEAEDFEKACRLLNKLGRKLVREGRLQLVNSYLTRIPDIYLNNDPWLRYTQARVLELTGNSPDAILAYKKAHKTFVRSASLKGEALCLNRLGCNYYFTGDFLRAERMLKELLKQVQGDPRLSIDILGNLVFISSHLGEMTVADQYYEKGMSLLTELNEESLLAWLNFSQGFRYCFSGDAAKALSLGEQTEKLCKKLDLHYLRAMNYHLISWSCYNLCLFSKGLENVEKGLNLVNERGFRESSHAWLLTDSALNAAALGRITDAIHDGKESLRIFEDLGSRWGQAWAYYVLCDVYMKSGNMLATEESARTGIKVIDGLSLPLQEGLLKGYLAMSLANREEQKNAEPLLEEAEKLLKKSKLIVSRVYLWHTRFYWEQQQKEAALSKLLAALQLSEVNQYDVWVISEKGWIIPLLVEAFAQGKMQDYVQRVFEKIGPYATKELVLLQKTRNKRKGEAAFKILEKIRKAPPPGLRVYCLGKFRVFRGDEEISTGRWKSKNAKILFKFLLYKRSHGYVKKDILMELLWPEEDPRKTAKRLHVALTSLRKTLEPEILRGKPSSYLLREGEAYTIDLGADGKVDIDEFREELKLAKEGKNAENAVSHYLNAEDIYHGDFLEEDLYIDWCAEERERLRDEYLDLLGKIIEHFEKRGDYPRCIEYSRKYLKMDKSAENIYQRLMKYYFQIGNRAMVVRTFERCKENIMKELDSPLSKETEEVYRELVST